MRSRLFNTTCYAIGAMDRVKDGGIGWRRKLIPELNKLGVIVFDPTNKPTTIGIEDEKNRHEIEQLKIESRFDEASKLVKLIRTIDLRFVDLSHFIVCNLNTEIHACGTYEEFFWANRLKRPILTHIEQGKKNIPNWLLGCIPHEHIFNSWDDLLVYLRDVAYGENPKTFNRWMFFDMRGPTEQMLAAYEGST